MGDNKRVSLAESWMEEYKKSSKKNLLKSVLVFISLSVKVYYKLYTFVGIVRFQNYNNPKHNYAILIK